MSEQRGALRTEADYLVEFRAAGRNRSGTGKAVDHSETGMSFVTRTPLEQGSYVTVRVPLSTGRGDALTCLANVVRCLSLPDGSGYAVGCAYD